MSVMVKGKTPDSADELHSNNRRLTYRKGVLLCSSVSDVANPSTLAITTNTPSINGTLPKNRSSLQHQQNSLRSSRDFEEIKSHSKEHFNEPLTPINHTGVLNNYNKQSENNNVNGIHYSTIVENEEIPNEPVKIVNAVKSKATVLKRSDIVSTTHKSADSHQEGLKEEGRKTEDSNNNNKARGKKGFTFGKSQPQRSQAATVASSPNPERKTQQLVPLLADTSGGPTQSELKVTMASSVMNQHHPHYSNYNQRNYNNNNMNMSHGQYASTKKTSSSTGGSNTTTNGYYNYPHSASMNEITDNRYYTQNQNSTNSAYYNSIGNQSSTNNSNLSHNLHHNQIETRKEQRERREREFVPSFVLIDACKSNNERKVKEICRKLSTLTSDDVQPVANFQDQTGRTPMSYACAGGNVMIVDELSRVRLIEPNLADNDGNTPLHYAAQAGHSEAVDLMLSRFDGALDINCRNSTGLTPLMKAALQGRTRCAKSLLSAGASSHLRDYSRGMTAAEWARLCGRHICAEVITRSAKDNQRHSGSPVADRFPTNGNRPLPGSRSMELKRMNSDESPYYHLYARSTISGATWLKNKIKKALGASGGNPPSVRSLADRRPTVSDGSYTLMSNLGGLGGATICAGSLLLPSIKPLIDQQRPKPVTKKFTIPTVQVTPVKR